MLEAKLDADEFIVGAYGYLSNKYKEPQLQGFGFIIARLIWKYLQFL